MTWPLGLNIIAIAPESKNALDQALSDIQKQAQVTRSLLDAEQLLKGSLSHNHKFNRVRPTLKFIYGKSDLQDDSQWRREALASLDLSACALCALAFSPRAITQMTDNTFEALLAGITCFVRKKDMAGTIDLQIGEFIRRTVRDIAEDVSTPLLWVEGRALKRQKKESSANKKTEGPLRIEGHGTATESNAVSCVGGGTVETTQHELRRAPNLVLARASRNMSQNLPKQPPTTVATASNATSPARPAQGQDIFRYMPPSDGEPGSSGTPTPSAPDQAVPDVLNNANYWFSRGITLSEQELMEQLQVWLANSDIPEET